MFDGIAEYEGRETELPNAIVFKMFFFFFFFLLLFFYCFFLIYFYLTIW